MSALKRIFNKKKLSHMIDELKDDILPDDEEEDIDEDNIDLVKKEAIEDYMTEAEDPETEEEYPIVEREIHPAKIICPDCGGITLEGLEFCDKCGGELQ